MFDPIAAIAAQFIMISTPSLSTAWKHFPPTAAAAAATAAAAAAAAVKLRPETFG